MFDSFFLLSNLSAVGAGVAAGALCYVGMRSAARHVDTSARSPPVRKLSQPLPVLWHLSWPLLCLLAPLCRKTLSTHAAARLATRMACAGMPPEVAPAHVSAAARVSFAMMALPLIYAQLHLVLPMHTLGVTILSAAWIGGVWPALWLAARARVRRRLVERELPFTLDMLALCVQAGSNIQSALLEVVQHGHMRVLGEELGRVLAEMRAGQTRSAAFLAFSKRVASPALKAWVDAMAHADTFGVSLVDQLREQAAAQNVARFERAERLALQAPVKMLLPLVLFIFPCTFIVIAFPLGVAMFRAAS